VFDYMTVWGHSAGARLGRNAMPGLWMTGAASALLARNRPGVLHADLAACAAWTTGPSSAAKVTCPTLIVAGAEDVMTPARKSAEIAALIKGATSITLPRTGHMIIQEAPDACLDALRGHFC
jgi:pimeloyl-ACP methyl ester carboxylesterase